MGHLVVTQPGRVSVAAFVWPRHARGYIGSGDIETLKARMSQKILSRATRVTAPFASCASPE